MSQRSLNSGTSGNAGNGTPLRTATAMLYDDIFDLYATGAAFVTQLGLYYLKTNPSGFITGIVAGSGVVVSQSGANFIINATSTGGAANTGALTGAFYPLASNPSGYLSASGVTIQGGATILDGQLLVGASGINGFQQGNLVGTAGIVITSGSGSLTIASPTGRQTIWLPANAISAATTSGATAAQIALGTNYPDMISLDYTKTNITHGLFSVNMPKSWDVGPVYSQFVWSVTGLTGNVAWRLQALKVSKSGSMTGNAFAGGVTVTDQALSGNYQYISPETSALTISGSPQINDMIYYRISRVTSNAGDTLSGNARLMGVKLIYGVTGLVDN